MHEAICVAGGEAMINSCGIRVMGAVGCHGATQLGVVLAGDVCAGEGV